MGRRKRSERNCERTVDRIRSTVCTERIPLLDRGRKTRADDWSTDLGVFRTPDKWERLDAMLVRVGFEVLGKPESSILNRLTSKNDSRRVQCTFSLPLLIRYQHACNLRRRSGGGSGRRRQRWQALNRLRW